MKIIITEKQLKYIIREGRYSNPVLFKLATDMFNHFIEKLKTSSIGNDFYKTMKIILREPNIDYNELYRLQAKPKYYFYIKEIINGNGLHEYIRLIDKNNKKLIDFITKINKNIIGAYYNIDLSLNKGAYAGDVHSSFRNEQLVDFDLNIYRYKLIKGVRTKNNYNVENLTNEQILDGVLYDKDSIIETITHELQHAYDSYLTRKTITINRTLKSDKNLHNFYNKFLKKELSNIKFDDDPKQNEEIKNYVRYVFQKHEIWARIQEYFNEMNLENPTQVVYFYNENKIGKHVISMWAKRFADKVLQIDLLDAIKLKDKIPIDKFRRYLYKVFYQMLSYKVKLIMDNNKNKL